MRKNPVTKADQSYFTQDDEMCSITLRYPNADNEGPWSTWQGFFAGYTMQGLTHWAAEAALMDRSICMLTLIEPTRTAQSGPSARHRNSVGAAHFSGIRYKCNNSTSANSPNVV